MQLVHSDVSGFELGKIRDAEPEPEPEPEPEKNGAAPAPKSDTIMEK